jgi:hypothetical protein
VIVKNKNKTTMVLPIGLEDDAVILEQEPAAAQTQESSPVAV